jgi:hypothetical protein
LAKKRIRDCELGFELSLDFGFAADVVHAENHRIAGSVVSSTHEHQDFFVQMVFARRLMAFCRGWI